MRPSDRLGRVKPTGIGFPPSRRVRDPFAQRPRVAVSTQWTDNMKISDIYRHYFGCEFDGKLDAGRVPGKLGPCCAELLARVAGRVRLEALYTTGSEFRGPRYVRGQEARATFDGREWTVAYDGDHASWYVSDPWWSQVRRGVRSADRLFGGHWSRRGWTRWEIDDVDVVDIAAVEAAIAEDDAVARESVVWRPRENQFVIRVNDENGDGVCLDPDGTEWSFRANKDAMNALAASAGVPPADLPRALANDPVVGRSRYTAPTLLERVVGFGTVRRIRRAQQA